jgi:hypothetical protein
MRTVAFYGDILNVCDASEKHIKYGLFRNLTEDEKVEFHIYARDELEDGVTIDPLWHPHIQDYLFITGKGVEGE